MFTDHCYQCPSGDSLHSCARFRAKINYHDLAIEYCEAKMSFKLCFVLPQICLPILPSRCGRMPRLYCLVFDES